MWKFTLSILVLVGLNLPNAGREVRNCGNNGCAVPQKSATVHAQRPQVKVLDKPLTPISKVSNPDQAINWAIADLKALDRTSQVFTRYLWNRSGVRVQSKQDSLTTNYISRASVIHRSPMVAGGYLLRVDLRLYYPQDKDLQEAINLWEQFQFDPAFSRFFTKDMIESLLREGKQFPNVVEVGKKRILIQTTPYVEDGVTLNSKWVDLIRQTGPHLDPRIAELQRLTGSSAPIVENDYFTFRSLSTVKDDGVFKDIWGGLYYELVGIKKAKDIGDKKGTDLDVLFRQLGLGDAEKGLTAEDIIEQARADQRVAVFRSKVTGKPREIIFLNIPASRFGEQQGFVIITQDLKDKDVDISTHPIMNFRKFVAKTKFVAAREVIFTTVRGLHGFALFDGIGALQDEAPFDVVLDHTIPAPLTKRLQGAKSCIICHGTDGSDGLKPVTNDVQALVRFYRGKPRLDIFGDTEEINKSIPDVLDRFAGQYAGSPDQGLRRGRVDYIKFIQKATGPYKDGGDQTGIGKTAAQGYESLWKRYWYETVDASKALYDLGYEISPDKAVDVFLALVPPDPESNAGPFFQEDPRIAALKAGLEISRTDWSLVYSFVALRIKQNMNRLQEQKK